MWSGFRLWSREVASEAAGRREQQELNAYGINADTTPTAVIFTGKSEIHVSPHKTLWRFKQKPAGPAVKSRLEPSGVSQGHFFPPPIPVFFFFTSLPSFSRFTPSLLFLMKENL